MNRLTLTAQDESAIAAWRSANNVDPEAPIIEGTNLVFDDHLQIDNNWSLVVLGSVGDGTISVYVPAFDGMIMGQLGCLEYITDRAGPNGETMPIYDEQLFAAAKQASEEKKQRNPKPASRSFRDALRDAVKLLPKAERKRARQTLRAQGVLGHELDDDEKE